MNKAALEIEDAVICNRLNALFKAVRLEMRHRLVALRKSLSRLHGQPFNGTDAVFNTIVKLWEMDNSLFWSLFYNVSDGASVHSIEFWESVTVWVSSCAAGDAKPTMSEEFVHNKNVPIVKNGKRIGNKLIETWSLSFDFGTDSDHLTMESVLAILKAAAAIPSWRDDVENQQVVESGRLFYQTVNNVLASGNTKLKKFEQVREIKGVRR